MKRIGTVFFFLTLAIGVSANSYGQTIHTAIKSVIPQSSVPPMLTPPHFSFPMGTLSTPQDSAIAYFDPDSSGNFNWYFLPTHINLNFGTPANPVDSQFIINRYAERFSLPNNSSWSKVYLDSIALVFEPVTFSDTTGNTFNIEVRPQAVLGTNGFDGFNFGPNYKPTDTTSFTPSDLTEQQVYATTIPLHSKLVGKNFVVVLYTPDSNQSSCFFAIRGDSVTFPTGSEPTTVDQNVYRGLWATESDLGYENDYTGITFTNQDGSRTDQFWTNFVVVAYVSNALLNAVDENGKPQFVLEQNFPNPVGSESEIDYNLTSAAPVSLTVYNQLGEQVASVVNDVEDAGGHSATFHAGTLPNGMYCYKLQSGDFTATRTMIINR